LKTELEKSIVHLFFEWCKRIGVKKIFRFGLGGAVYLAIVLSFDWFYMPWLAIQFRYLAIVPLYFSLFIISWIGLFVYRFFREDIFLLGTINEWLRVEGNYKITKAIKKKMNENPKFMFAAISTWWSPLHAYLFFKKDKNDNIAEYFKAIGLGAFYCSLFWGVVIDVLVLAYDLAVFLFKNGI
jgi:hypothetical protein